jgi:hypothetical protein
MKGSDNLKLIRVFTENIDFDELDSISMTMLCLIQCLFSQHTFAILDALIALCKMSNIDPGSSIIISAILRIAENLGYHSVNQLWERYLYHILIEWCVSAEEFPHYLTACKTKNEFYIRFHPFFVAAYACNSKDLLQNVAIELKSRELPLNVEKVFALLIYHTKDWKSHLNLLEQELNIIHHPHSNVKIFIELLYLLEDINPFDSAMDPGLAAKMIEFSLPRHHFSSESEEIVNCPLIAFESYLRTSLAAFGKKLSPPEAFAILHHMNRELIQRNSQREHRRLLLNGYLVAFVVIRPEVFTSTSVHICCNVLLNLTESESILDIVAPYILYLLRINDIRPIESKVLLRIVYNLQRACPSPKISPLSNEITAQILEILCNRPGVSSNAFLLCLDRTCPLYHMAAQKLAHLSPICECLIFWLTEFGVEYWELPLLHLKHILDTEPETICGWAAELIFHLEWKYDHLELLKDQRLISIYCEVMVNLRLRNHFPNDSLSCREKFIVEKEDSIFNHIIMRTFSLLENGDPTVMTLCLELISDLAHRQDSSLDRKEMLGIFPFPLYVSEFYCGTFSPGEEQSWLASFIIDLLKVHNVEYISLTIEMLLIRSPILSMELLSCLLLQTLKSPNTKDLIISQIANLFGEAELASKDFRTKHLLRSLKVPYF